MHDFRFLFRIQFKPFRMVPFSFNSLFFFFFSEQFFMNLWPKKKKLVRPKKTANHEAEYHARLKTDAENGQPIA